MTNKERPQFVRETVQNSDNEMYEARLVGENKMFGYYVLAGAIGVICALGPLVARGCYHKLQDEGVIAKHEHVKQENPKYCRRN